MHAIPHEDLLFRVTVDPGTDDHTVHAAWYHASVANAQAGSVPFRIMCVECQFMVVDGDDPLELQMSRERQVVVRRELEFDGLTDVRRLKAVSHWDVAAVVLCDGRARLLFLRAWLTRMRHRPILGNSFRVQHATDELASQVVQLFGAVTPTQAK